jgi:hypothetical protein
MENCKGRKGITESLYHKKDLTQNTKKVAASTNDSRWNWRKAHTETID